MKNDYISEIYEKDKLVLHPYENFNDRGTYNRKLINSAKLYRGIYNTTQNLAVK